MLEGIGILQTDDRVYRFANVLNFEDMLTEMGLGAEDIDEILEFLGESRDPSEGQRLLDAPFTPKPQLEARRITPTRFSDGSLRVFYSSLELETAELEVLHWYADAAFGSTPRVVFYNRLRCRMQGPAVDLRPVASDWSFLIEDGDEAYARCQALAREGVERDVAAFLTPSARRRSGTNAPVFRREVLSEPEVLGVAAFSRDGQSGAVTVRYS